MRARTESHTSLHGFHAFSMGLGLWTPAAPPSPALSRKREREEERKREREKERERERKRHTRQRGKEAKRRCYPPPSCIKRMCMLNVCMRILE